MFISQNLETIGQVTKKRISNNIFDNFGHNKPSEIYHNTLPPTLPHTLYIFCKDLRMYIYIYIYIDPQWTVSRIYPTLATGWITAQRPNTVFVPEVIVLLLLPPLEKTARSRRGGDKAVMHRYVISLYYYYVPKSMNTSNPWTSSDPWMSPIH